MTTKFRQVKTKIVATLGPATSNYESILALVKAGANMFRLNTSHGTALDHKKNIENIRKVSKECNTYIPILVDLQGPKIRVGNITTPINITKNDTIILSGDSSIQDSFIIPVDYPQIANDVSIGEKILLDDGKIGLEVLDNKNNQIKAKVLYGEIIKPRKGINIPGATASLDAVTERDKEFIQFSVENNIDYIALSFVREAHDIELAKKIIKDFNGEIPIIAKIEKPQAVENLDSILSVTDGIMVARGDLGIEISPEEVPTIQKYIIDKTIRERKVCIVATQMLETMIENPIPTRAEASDVANAILDGTDAIMLSGETAVGKYPIEAVKMMRKIASNVENCNFCLSNLDLEIIDKYDITPQAIANAAVKMAQDINAKAIMAFTHSGYTPRLLSKLRPTVPIIAISDREDTCRRLNLFWNIFSDYKKWDRVIDENLLKEIDEYILTKTDFKKDERIVIIGSIPKLISGRTNFIRVHRIGA